MKKSTLEKELLDAMWDDPKNWKAGLIYVNNKDPRLIVPKRNLGMGWTFNFASPYSYITMVLIIGIAILISKLSK